MPLIWQISIYRTSTVRKIWRTVYFIRFWLIRHPLETAFRTCRHTR